MKKFCESLDRVCIRGTFYELMDGSDRIGPHICAGIVKNHIQYQIIERFWEMDANLAAGTGHGIDNLSCLIWLYRNLHLVWKFLPSEAPSAERSGPSSGKFSNNCMTLRMKLATQSGKLPVESCHFLGWEQLGSIRSGYKPWATHPLLLWLMMIAVPDGCLENPEKQMMAGLKGNWAVVWAHCREEWVSSLRSRSDLQTWYIARSLRGRLSYIAKHCQQWNTRKFL